MNEDEKTAKQYGATVLAYLGDAVVEVRVRTMLISLGITDTGRFNSLAQEFVTAKTRRR